MAFHICFRATSLLWQTNSGLLLRPSAAYWLAKVIQLLSREMAIIAGPQKENEFRLILAVPSRSTSDGYMRGTIITSAVNGILIITLGV